MTPIEPAASGGGAIPRRTFLATGLAGLAAGTRSALAGPSLGDRAASVWPLGPRWRLTATSTVESFHDGTEAPFLRFQTTGATAGTIPLLSGAEGSLALLTIDNTLDREIQPWIVGLGRGPIVPAGSSRDMMLRLPAAGTWLVTDARLGRVAGPVGLGAVLVVRRKRTPATERVDREYVLVYQDADDRWNLDVNAGVEPDRTLYEPNLHTLNGLSYPDTLADPTTKIVCGVGERVLLRLANLGLVRHSIHFHGYHVDVLERDRVRETAWPAKDTIPLPGYSTAELRLDVNQPGAYPVHPHTLTSVTDNGLYAHGQITLIQAT